MVGMRKNCTVYYSSETGTAKKFAKTAAELFHLSFKTKLVPLDRHPLQLIETVEGKDGKGIFGNYKVNPNNRIGELILPPPPKKNVFTLILGDLVGVGMINPPYTHSSNTQYRQS